jgi:hypothetical protein
MALCTSSLPAETPRSAYRLLVSELCMCSIVIVMGLFFWVGAADNIFFRVPGN